MKLVSKNDSGVLVIAYGRQKYINMAGNLAISLRLKNPGLPIALVTDDTQNSKLKSLYDIIIPVDPNLGKGLIQKLYMIDYSPFQRTMFIDSDCLVVGKLDFLFNALAGRNIAVVGNTLTEGEWLGINISAFIQKYQLPYLIPFNGGMYYFEKTDTAKQIFQMARELSHKYDDLGFMAHNEGRNEEPLMSYAMAKYHEKPYVDEQKSSMYTPIGIRGSLHIDILTGYCSFIKYTQKVAPTIVHFPGSFSDSFFYKREVIKAKISNNQKLPTKWISAVVNFVSNAFYISFIFFYRTYLIVKGKKCQFLPLMPPLKKLACST